MANIYSFLIVIAIFAAMAYIYRMLMIRAFGKLQNKSALLVPLDHLSGFGDYRDFFGFLNQFSRQSLNFSSSSIKKLPNSAKVGPFHFIMAFSNLVEIERDKFAHDPLLLKKVNSIFAKYNQSIWDSNEEASANSIANYVRVVKGEDTAKPTFFISSQFDNLLRDAEKALSEYNLFKAHLILQKQESSTNLTDLELLVLNYLLARLSSHFQGVHYNSTEDSNRNIIDNIRTEISVILKNSKDAPKSVFINVPNKSFKVSQN